MPFVLKDANGKITAVYTEPVQGAVEIAPGDPELTAFIQQNIPSAGPLDDWAQSDLALARVIEDLIEVLIAKKLIMFSDFPEGAQQKLRDRRGLRKEYDLVEDLFGDGEEEFETGDGDEEGFL